MEGELQLNLTSSSTLTTDNNKRKQSEINEDDPEYTSGHEKKRPKRAHQIEDASKKEKHGPSGSDFISSLFNHNPEIPKIDLAGIEPRKEEIFSARTFADTAIHPYIIKGLQDQGMPSLTLVQSKAIPVVLSGKDALIKSQTGSGKTLAYAVPILHKMQEERPEVTRKDGVRALIIVPTRELAIQTMEWMVKLCRSFSRIVPGILCGGEKKKSEKARLRKGINILIATPGRLIDHIRLTKTLSLKSTNWVVLDEADRALELGYERDVRAIISALDEQQKPEEDSGPPVRVRQTLLCSATLTKGIEQLSEISLRHPVFVDAASDDTSGDDCLTTLTTPDNLRQNFIIVPAKLRLVALATFLLWKSRFGRPKKSLVFFATQDMVDFHAELFARTLNYVEKIETHKEDDDNESNWTDDAKKVFGTKPRVTEKENDSFLSPINISKLHGSMSQKDRTDTFKSFRESDTGVLFCTDVAARGLDLPQVDWIVQFNAPLSHSDYVHRVGRTARIGAKGSSLLFVLPSEAGFIQDLEGKNLILSELTINHLLQKLQRNAHLAALGEGRRLPNTMEEAATNLQMKLENAVLSDDSMHEKACEAYVSFVRAYASYPKEIREIFSFKALHLGHLAKSFALRDPPSRITGIGKGKWVHKQELKKLDGEDTKKEERVIQAQRKRINQKSLVLSEFSSGFDGIVDSIPGGTRKEVKKYKKFQPKKKL